MPLELEIVPCLSDNYAYIIHDAETGRTAVVDVPEAEPIRERLERLDWKLTDILLTHHHSDHIDGVDRLRQTSGARVWGAAADIHRLPPLDETLDEGTDVDILGETVRILDVPGHTVGHIALYFAESGLVFTGDSLMALGCGRLFEGTPEQMWSSLKKLAALPDDARVCSGHEYTQANAKFAMSVDPENPALKSRAADIDKLRQKGHPTVPSRIGEEKQTNPFLRADDPGLKSATNQPDASDVEAFAKIRRMKDSF